MTLNLENYTRTDNPDGSLTFTPVKEPVKVSKRFVPKEGDTFWYMLGSGTLSSEFWCDDRANKGCLAMGNVYRTREEAEKARDKQLALVRIQNYIADNELGKEFVYGENNYYITYEHRKKGFFPDCWSTFEYNPPLGYLKSPEACTQVIENCTKDLLIVWGRK